MVRGALLLLQILMIYLTSWKPQKGMHNTGEVLQEFPMCQNTP